MHSTVNLAVLAALATACHSRDDDSGVPAPDASGGGVEYGTVQPLAAATSGLVGANYRALLGVTTAAGNLGCAVIRDEKSSPGASSSIVYTKIDASSGDTRCPAGAYAIRNDVAYCGAALHAGINPGCALYKQWDASGTQIASRFAIGGYVNVQDVRQYDSLHTCTVEVSTVFAGGVTIAKTFKFDFNPYAPDDAFCTH